MNDDGDDYEGRLGDFSSLSVVVAVIVNRSPTSFFHKTLGSKYRGTPPANHDALWWAVPTLPNQRASLSIYLEVLHWQCG